MGSYFGSSLCAVDLNQDGLSDLLVGAPMHSQLRDEGQVSVYLSKGNVSGMCGSVGTQCHDLKIYFTTVCLVPLFKLHIYTFLYCYHCLQCGFLAQLMFDFFLLVFVIMISE